MRSLKLLRRPLAAAILLAVAGTSQAAISVFTTQASFLAAVTAPGVDTFANLSVTSETATPLNRSAGSYTYRATAPDGFFGAGSAANPWLSTNTAVDPITFSNFSAGVSAIGGFFVGSDVNGAFTSGSLTLLATDVLGATSTQTIAGGVTSFLGFVSTTSMTSLVLSAVQPAGGFLWPAADNMTLATAAVTAPVPEPETYALLLSGLGLLGVLGRRRRFPS
jgi:hypothetical protein